MLSKAPPPQTPEPVDDALNTTAEKPSDDSLQWSELAYELGLQGLAQEIAVNSVVDSFESNRLRLKLTPELKEIASSSIEQEIQQAVNSKLNVSCKLELVSQPGLDVETPYKARLRRQEAHRQAAISVIKESELVVKLNRAFGVELIESSVRKIDD